MNQVSKTPHFKSVILYFVAFLVLAIIFFFFGSAYRDLDRYIQLTDRNIKIHIHYQNLSRHITNAAVMNPDLMTSIKKTKTGKTFQTDRNLVISQLRSLKSLARDSVNLSIIRSLDNTVRAELLWILESNVPDSIIHNRATDKINKLESINTLIEKGIQRTHHLREKLRTDLNKKSNEVKAWMILFIISSVSLLVYSIADLFKQRRKDERRFQALVENGDDIIALIDNNMYPAYRSPSAQRLTGYSLDERQQTHQLDDIHNDDIEKVNSCLNEMKARPGAPVALTYRSRHKNGHYLWLEGTFTSLFHNSDIGGIVVNMKDVSLRKNEEFQNGLVAEISTSFNEPEDLKITLQKVLRRLVAYDNFILAEMWIVSKDETRISLSARFSPNEDTDRFYEQNSDIKSFSKGTGLPGITWKLNTIKEWHDVTDEKDFIRKAAAKDIKLDTILGIPVTYNGDVIGVLLLGRQHSDKKYAEADYSFFTKLCSHIGAEIRRKLLEDELNQIFNLSPDILCTIGTDTLIKKINPAGCRLLEYAEHELLSCSVSELAFPDDRPTLLEQISDLTGGAGTCYFENRFLTATGKIIYLAWTIYPSVEDDLMFAVAKDITEKKDLELLLNKANSLARLGSWEYDVEEQSVYWSDITREIHGVDENYVLTLDKGIEFYKGEHRDIIKDHTDKALKTGLSWDSEHQIITADGKEKWIRVIGETEFVNGICKRIYGSFQDIDSLKQAEIRLKQSVKTHEDYLFALNESSIIAITDSRGVIISVNDNFCKISKYSKEELIGHTHKIINSGFHPKQFFRDLWTTISSGKTWRGEIKNVTKDGEYYWVYTTITPFLDKNGKPFQYLAIRFDITEKKIAEEALIYSLNEKKTILESIDDAFFAVDRNWLITYWNNRAEKILGRAKAESIGNNLWSIFKESASSESYKKYHDSFNSSHATHFEDYNRTLNKWYEVSAYPSGNGLSVYLKDVTERKAFENDLKELNESLKKQAKELSVSNNELEQFAYVASHDLQEPLRMVTGFLSQLEKKYGGIIDARGKKYIDFAVDGARRMRQIILDLLEFSRVGRTDDDKEEVDLNELIHEARILFSKQIEEKKASVEAEQLPSVYSYKAPLRQVFQNLIGNALKYSRENVPAVIKITHKELTDHWQFTIADNGIGIDEEYFERIFIIFQRLHNKDEFSGTGMGLAITKKIVENMAGKIWVESADGLGSSFHFTIKKQQSE